MPEAYGWVTLSGSKAYIFHLRPDCSLHHDMPRLRATVDDMKNAGLIACSRCAGRARVGRGLVGLEELDD